MQTIEIVSAGGKLVQMESTCVCATSPGDIAHEWTRNAIMQPALFSLCPQPEAAAQIRLVAQWKANDVKNLRNTCISRFPLLPSCVGYPVLGAHTRGDFLSSTEKAIAWRRNFSRIWCGAHTCKRDEWGFVWFLCQIGEKISEAEGFFALNGQAFAFKKRVCSLLFVAPEMRVKRLPVLTLFSGLLDEFLKGIWKRLPNISNASSPPLHTRVE